MLIALLALLLQDSTAAIEGGELLKYLPESVSVTAVIAVVILFLRQQRQTAAEHRAQLELAQKQFEDALERIETSHQASFERVSASIDRVNSNLDRLAFERG